MSEMHNTTDLLRALEPVVEKELNRHEGMVKNWNPHDYVPWSDGRNFAYLGGEDWQPTQSKLGKAARAAMYINLLTEDNLPSYHRVISDTFGRDSAWGTWVDRWTAEEGKHSIAMRDFLIVTRAIDPVQLEQSRMLQVSAGFQSDKSPLDAVAYVTMQELATRIAHRNTGLESKKDGDELADKLLARIALDENLHMLFYRNIGTAAFEMAPNEMMKSVAKEIIGFQMPGSMSIPEFWANAAVIADAEIYDLNIHANKIVKPTLEHWNIWNREDLTDEGAAAREKLGRFMVKLEQKASEVAEQHEQQKSP